MKHRPQKADQGRWIREEFVPSPEMVAWLSSKEGHTICQRMVDEEPADTPSAIARWREQLPIDQVTTAWQQVCLRAAARTKFSRADAMLFDRISLQQATDEVIARHKAHRFTGASAIADLCCGIGGDALALAEVAPVTAVDWSPARSAMAKHNAGVYGQTITALVEDVTFCRPPADAVHIDPDRRPQGPRRHDPQAGSPSLAVLAQIVAHYEHAAIKLSPGANFENLGIEGELELISHHGQCKQAVLWTGRFRRHYRQATALPGGESVTADTPAELDWPTPVPVEPGQWLFEPDPAVIRAHLVGPLAREHDLAPIDTRIAYLTGDHAADTALLTPFHVLETADFSLPTLRAMLAGRNIGRLEIKTRGFAAHPEEILRRLRPAGRDSATLFLTRIGSKARAILTRRPDPAEAPGADSPSPSQTGLQ